MHMRLVGADSSVGFDISMYIRSNPSLCIKNTLTWIHAWVPETLHYTILHSGHSTAFHSRYENPSLWNTSFVVDYLWHLANYIFGGRALITICTTPPLRRKKKRRKNGKAEILMRELGAGREMQIFSPRCSSPTYKLLQCWAFSNIPPIAYNDTSSFTSS